MKSISHYCIVSHSLVRLCCSVIVLQFSSRQQSFLKNETLLTLIIKKPAIIYFRVHARVYMYTVSDIFIVVCAV